MSEQETTAEQEALIADIAAWHEETLDAGFAAPDFWDECCTSEELAKWLIARGWRKAA